MRSFLAFYVALWMFAAPSWAQEPSLGEEVWDEESFETIDLPPTLDLTPLSDPTSRQFDDRPPGFGDDLRALEAFRNIQFNKFVRARELTEEILRENPEAYTGHCLLGLVQHRAEGNLPLALFHLKTCRERVEELYGPRPGDDTPWFWHAISLIELAMVSGEMDRHEDKIRYLEERDAIYEPPWPADRGWPLMRLRRYDEARQMAQLGLMMTDYPGQIATARTALCAIEAEELNREASYLACVAAADYERITRGGPTPFTNAAEAALGILRMDEAEAYILEATERFSLGAVANPWLDLTHLYLAQARTAEALDAVRRMFQWRNRQPPYVDVQNRAETEMASAIFLLVAGYPFEAAKITARALEQPDRTGFTSAESEQMEVAAALLDRRANHMAAELLEEEAVAQPFLEGLQSRLQAQRHRLKAWASGRRAASMMADERILLTSIRPYLAGAVEMPEWFEPELVEVLGPGLVGSAVRRAREQETLQEAEGYFLAFEAEIAWRSGDEKRALELVDRAFGQLPISEVLLQARLAAIGAQAAYDLGRTERAFDLFDRAWQEDPGVIRRLGLALPTVFASNADPIAKHALRALQKSPRFERASTGFRIQVTAQQMATTTACLTDTKGTLLICAEARPRAGEDQKALGWRLAREFQSKVFAPRLDLTQADLASLDGSPIAGGGRGAERLRSVLSDVIDQTGGEVR